MNRRTDDVLDGGFTDHVFVCTNAHDGPLACCAEVGGVDVFDRVVEWLAERDVLWSEVYVGTCSCLGLCSEGGTALAIYPRGEWYSDVERNDIPALMTEELGPDAERLGVTH